MSLAAVTSEFRRRPMSVAVPLMFIPVGLLTIVLGERTSRAFTVIGGGLAAHLLGVILFAGGLLVLLGIGRGDTFLETTGLAAVGAGAAFYAAGVFIGLHTGGLITGLVHLSITAGAWGRVWLLTSLAHRAAGQTTQQ